MDLGGTVFEAMVDLVVVVDMAGEIVHANAAASRMSEYSGDELRELPISQLIIDERLGDTAGALERIAAGIALRSDDAWLVSKSGHRVPVSVTASGSAIGVVVVARDVASQRQAAQELRDSLAARDERLRFAERRATLGVLAEGIGHELGNIAQVLVAVADEIFSTFPVLDETLSAALRDLTRTGEQVQRHGARLTQLVRPGPDHVQPAPLSPVIHDVVTMLRSAGRLTSIDVRLSLCDVMVSVNRTWIEQILVRLLVNASQAITPPGSITIITTAQKSRVLVEVSDTGAGIEHEHLDRIFDAGLGLSIAREIVERYGGKLEVSSSRGSGAAFRFDLPVVAATAS